MSSTSLQSQSQSACELPHVSVILADQPPALQLDDSIIVIPEPLKLPVALQPSLPIHSLKSLESEPKLKEFIQANPPIEFMLQQTSRPFPINVLNNFLNLFKKQQQINGCPVVNTIAKIITDKLTFDQLKEKECFFTSNSAKINPGANGRRIFYFISDPLSAPPQILDDDVLPVTYLTDAPQNLPYEFMQKCSYTFTPSFLKNFQTNSYLLNSTFSCNRLVNLYKIQPRIYNYSHWSRTPQTSPLLDDKSGYTVIGTSDNESKWSNSYDEFKYFFDSMHPKLDESTKIKIKKEEEELGELEDDNFTIGPPKLPLPAKDTPMRLSHFKKQQSDRHSNYQQFLLFAYNNMCIYHDQYRQIAQTFYKEMPPTQMVSISSRQFVNIFIPSKAKSYLEIVDMSINHKNIIFDFQRLYQLLPHKEIVYNMGKSLRKSFKSEGKIIYAKLRCDVFLFDGKFYDCQIIVTRFDENHK